MQLEWEKKTTKNQLTEKLEKAINSIVDMQIKEINSKIEVLCSMGVIKDVSKIEEIKEKMKQLQIGNQ